MKMLYYEIVDFIPSQVLEKANLTLKLGSQQLFLQIQDFYLVSESVILSDPVICAGRTCHYIMRQKE